MLSDDVDSDEDDQKKYKKQKLRELYAGKHQRRVRPRTGGFGCPFCNQIVDSRFSSVLQHAAGRAIGSFKQKPSRRVAHAAYAEYLASL